MPSLGGRGRYGGSDVGRTGSNGRSDRMGRSGRDHDSYVRENAQVQAEAQAQEQAQAQAAAQAAAKAEQERKRLEAIEKTKAAGERNRATFFQRNTTPIGLMDEIKQRGLSSLTDHAVGLLPGVDVQARNWKGTNAPAPSETTFKVPRMVGDIVGLGTGIPGLGDMVQGGVDYMNAPDGTAQTVVASAQNEQPRGRSDGGEFSPMDQNGRWVYSQGLGKVVWEPQGAQTASAPTQATTVAQPSPAQPIGGLFNQNDVFRNTIGLAPTQRWNIPKSVG